MNILRVGVELLDVDEQTDGHEEADSRLTPFCEGAPQKMDLY